MKRIVRYAELTPTEFKTRLAQAPIAYLPLGTLEWHGEHLPLGSDGLQSEGFFCRLAAKAGGIVMPMLFLGPDRMRIDEGRQLYGMEIVQDQMPAEQRYPVQQLPGNAYWVPETFFADLIESILKQLQRAGFRIVVGHGHGPSTRFFADHADIWRQTLGLDCFTCWGGEPDQRDLGIQTDHAAANETSLMMALHPRMVHLENLPTALNQWPLAVWGKDPRVHASAEIGRRAMALHVKRMAGILRNAMAHLK